MIYSNVEPMIKWYTLKPPTVYNSEIENNPDQDEPFFVNLLNLRHMSMILDGGLSSTWWWNKMVLDWLVVRKLEQT